jgi:hypothetical protein
MIRILINNEALDLDEKSLVTFKKSQQLNGIQGQFSYSNNINLKPTSKNLRLLGINYLPNSKAKSMTQGYECDVILNGCIFLRKQKLKVQKEGRKEIQTYLIFSDNFFTVKSKEILLSSIDFGFTYIRNLTNFLEFNEPDANIFRTAPVSAQDESGLVVVQEVPALINIPRMVEKVINGLNYFPLGDFFTDTELVKYYTNPNTGVYVGSGVSLFDSKETCFDFLTKILKTFNAYIDISDSEKSAGVFLWKNIETIKKNFVDYSSKYVQYEDYSFEGGLAKKNLLEYSESKPFYNSYFENNKSILEQTTYLKTEFGAGSMRLFDDQEINDDNTIDLRAVNELGETSAFNIFKFEETPKEVTIYDNGVKVVTNMYKAFSPNIFELFEGFHYAYTKNISLPTVGNLTFRYDAIFLANFKMQEVFFIKDLSSYWLPLEINHTTDKDKVKVKSLMIEKTAPDVPLVYDLNVVLNYLETKTIIDANDLYFASNTSPQATFIVRNFDNTKNRVFVTGSDNIEVEVLSLPFTVDVTTQFILKFQAITAAPTIENSDLLFQFISEEGGISRIGKINIQNRGRVHLISEFKSPFNTQYTFTRSGISSADFYINKSQKILAANNIPVTNSISTTETNLIATAISSFKAIDLVQDQNLKLTLEIGQIILYIKKLGGGSGFDFFTRRTNLTFVLYKNGVLLQTLHSVGISVSAMLDTDTDIYNNVSNTFYFNALAGDDLAIFARINATNGSLTAGDLDTEVKLLNVNWKLECFQQI